MDTFPRLYTSRLILRKIEVDDVPALVKYANNRKISDYIINIPYPYQEPDAAFRISYVVQGFKAKSRYVFAIVSKESMEFIGEISLHMGPQPQSAQLGYWIGEPFWNKGYMTEAIGTVLKFGFEQLGLRSIYATCHEENMGSIKVLLKNGMQQGNMNGSVFLLQQTNEQYAARQSP